MHSNNCTKYTNDDIMDMLLKIYKIEKSRELDIDNIKSDLILLNQNIKNIYKQLKRLDLA